MTGINFKGFTLVELMVTVAIIAILATSGVAVYSNVSKNARDAKRKVDIESIAKTFEQKYTRNKSYTAITDSDFVSGVPVPPKSGEKYTCVVGSPFTNSTPCEYISDKAFKVCATLEGGTDNCSLSSSTCYCLTSRQGKSADEIISGSGGTFGGVPPESIGGGASSFRLWLKADKITGLTDGSTVSSWTDYSGNNNNATQSTEANKPVFKTGISTLNGKPAVRFDGTTNDFMSLAAQVIGSQQFTIFAVVNSTAVSAANREIFSNWDTTNTTTSIFIGHGNVSLTGIRLTDELANGGDVTSPSIHYILTGMSSGSNVTTYKNGAQIGARGSAFAVPRVLTTAYYIGKQGTYSGGEYWMGDIAEIIVYDGALLAPDNNVILNYLAGKYNISVTQF